MKTFLTFLGIAAAAAALSAGAVTVLISASFAGEPEHPRLIRLAPPEFAEVDADHDGMVTETEFLVFTEARRAAADFPSPAGTDRFAQADTDGDGVVSREEYESSPRKIVHLKLGLGDPKEMFAKADADHDSVLNEEEFNALFSKMHRLGRHTADSSAHDTP
jgi:hypothetical protein